MPLPAHDTFVPSGDVEGDWSSRGEGLVGLRYCRRFVLMLLDVCKSGLCYCAVGRGFQRNKRSSGTLLWNLCTTLSFDDPL